MPKLRNAATDIAQFTQWLGRKCRNPAVTAVSERARQLFG